MAGLQIQPVVGVAHQIGVIISTLHTWSGFAILWLAGLHAAAAIFHHLVLKDDVLVTMLPGWLERMIDASGFGVSPAGAGR
ncbi:hypothetical protein GALL_502790 [mine drainage metagenome]|uniref:Cytochrome b561 bacterial/Ni-hydrogenase domain-containing protein n=1 Tax=mine drainage metagenome TaxID=410659 RepID=A0A1J5PWY5_9ZZZZ